MKKLFVLLLALSLALAGGAFSGSRIRLQRGRRNNLNFACGTVDGSGSPTVASQRYSYSFSGYPSWLSVQGSSLVGTPPVSASGPWAVNVNYSPVGEVGTTGSSSFELGFDDASSSASSSYSTVTYMQGSLTSSGSYTYSSVGSSFVVLIPLIQTTVTVQQTPVYVRT